ncbi:hypothetical protein EDB80DRAFT_675995 [Ilyonectria destructans]|nr:hypothetical protein EDB80DRAFT_675995 [Ilyonectria destructans]
MIARLAVVLPASLMRFGFLFWDHGCTALLGRLDVCYGAAGATQHRRTLGDQPGRMPETRRDDDMAVMAHTGLTAIMTASLAGPPSHQPQVGFLPGRLPTPSPAKLAEVSRQPKRGGTQGSQAEGVHRIPSVRSVPTVRRFHLPSAGLRALVPPLAVRRPPPATGAELVRCCTHACPGARCWVAAAVGMHHVVAEEHYCVDAPSCWS